jgi:hypothetical protein
MYVLQEPNLFDAAGRPWLKFPRLVCGRAAQLFINMRNTGGMPAHARIEMDSHPCFQLLEGQQVGVGVGMACWCDCVPCKVACRFCILVTQLADNA